MSNNMPSKNLDDLSIRLQQNLATSSGEVNLLINMTRHTIAYPNVVNIHQNSGVAVLNNQTLFHFLEMQFHLHLDRLISAACSLNANVLLAVSTLDDISLAHSYFEMVGINYGIIIDEVNFKLKWQRWTYLSNSSFIVASNKSALKSFADSYIFPIVWWEDFVLSTELFTKYQPKIVDNGAKNTVKRVLLISYFGLNLNTVGVLRPNYWFRHIPSLSGHQLHIELATATKPATTEPNVHFIPDFGVDSSFSYNQAEHWLHNQLGNQVNTLGLSWNKELVAYFDSVNRHYDAVILTGNPFMHFYFSIYAKHKWGAIILQDYRDPLAKNPRMASEYEPIRSELEDRFCSMADRVITVNQVCAELMSKQASQPVLVIPNGFDDAWMSAGKGQLATTKLFDHSTGLESALFRQVKSIKSQSKILGKWVNRADQLINQQHFLPKAISRNDEVVRLVYAGSFSHDRNPKNLIQAVTDVLGFEFHHFGVKYKLSNHSSRIFSHGKTDQACMNEILDDFDIGVVYCGHDFESTTKIYDYIAKNLHILIITPQNNPKPRTLAGELNGLDGVHWVVDSEQAIRQFLQAFVNHPISRPQRNLFSRKTGTEQLINVLNSARGLQNVCRQDLPLIAKTQFSYQDLIQKQDSKFVRQRFEQRYLSDEQQVMPKAGEIRPAASAQAQTFSASTFNYQRLRFLTAELAMMQYQMQNQATQSLPKLKTIPRKNKKVLVLCADYPHRDSLYGGTFIVPRVQAYIRAGFKVSVFVLKEKQPAHNKISEIDTGIAIYRGNQKVLKQVLPKIAPSCIVAHSLSLSGYQVLKQLSLLDRLIVVYHGFEIRDVGHLWYNFSEENLAKNFRRIFEQDLIRKKLAIEIFQNSAITKVFVSHFLKDLCEEDLGLKSVNHQVIPNYIDEQLFNYVPKQDSDRLKIFSIRPYDNHNYAADLIITCIMELSKKPFFSELCFHIQGFGHTFKEKTKVVAHFDNVTVVEGILDQRQISQLHKHHGVALIPTRFDTQGVSLGEAMASGLVPVTNACAAITEFIPSDCAVLAPADDVKAMVRGIEEMYYSPEIFHQKSKQAASHIRKIAGKKATIDQELKLLNGRSSLGLLSTIKKLYT